ncbi:helix-turn-helix domain-containing protein [Acinetobacter junii]|uniref:helix-turn-helix domain-containing protein n=1 Tax=Acinetobacter junii TaxID=40215 RepID=UPI0002D03EED|nr:helix-turn-helix transcriptional regulator [Acinetobacter junii]ENV52051.1 hypothetical protein F953_00541 [Acinetobacter junii CIP 107470 = MTCC 11364]
MNETIAATSLGRTFALYIFTIQNEAILDLTLPLSLNDISCFNPDNLYEIIFNIATSNDLDVRFQNRLNLILNDLNLTIEHPVFQLSLTKFLSNPNFLSEMNVELNNIKNCLKLQQYKRNNNLSVKELASLLDVNHRNVSAWEKHKKNFNGKILNKLN